MGRINYVCEFGEVHSTANCRCMDSHVTTRQVKCDLPEHANKFMADIETGEKILQPLRERLEKTVDGFFGNLMMQVVKDALLDTLEKDVSEWLIEAAKMINKE